MLRVTLRGQTYFACEACGMIYEGAELASSCEAWCTSHGSCNLEITSQSVGRVSRSGLRLRGSGS